MATAALLQQRRARVFLYDSDGARMKKRRRMKAGRHADVAGEQKHELAPWRLVHLAGGRGVSPGGAGVSGSVVHSTHSTASVPLH